MIEATAVNQEKDGRASSLLAAASPIFLEPLYIFESLQESGAQSGKSGNSDKS